MKLGYNPLNTIPRDITAKKVVYDKGDKYDAKVKGISVLHSTLPLPIRKTIPNHLKRDPNFRDLSGIKFGYLTVVGLFALDKYDKWVVRCACGCYEVRRSTIINSNPTEIDRTRCLGCLDLERLRHKDFFKRYGYYPWQKPKRKFV